MLDFWIIIFSATIIQGSILSVALYKKAKRKATKSVLYLSGLIILFTLTLTNYLVFWLGFSDRAPVFFNLFLLLPLLFGPFLYAYFNHGERKANPELRLHLIPFLVALLARLITDLSSLNLNLWIVILQITQLLTYAVYFLLKKRKKKEFTLSLTFSAFSLSFMTYYILVWTGQLQVEYDYFVSLGMSFFIYFIGYQGLFDTDFISAPSAKKYESSSLTENAINHIVDQLDEIMQSEKLYLNGDLKLADVSKRLNLSTHNLSQAINSKKGQKFNDYVNEFRIREAKKLMLSPDNQHLKLLAIALESGFNNKTSFLNAFRKQTGMTPSDFRTKCSLTV